MGFLKLTPNRLKFTFSGVKLSELFESEVRFVIFWSNGVQNWLLWKRLLFYTFFVLSESHMDN